MWRTRRTEFELRSRFAEILQGIPAPIGDDEPADLIDVVLGLDGDFTPNERGQLLQRLILSAVGFTGITLEWVILLAYQNGQDSADLTETQARQLVLEALRLYPTAWRLWREVEKPHTVGGCPVEHGGQVMIHLQAMHRSEKLWDEPDEFDPRRWDGATREQRAAFLPFGKGERMCPASGFALRALEDLSLSILREYSGEVRFTGKQPLARTLLAPPRGWTKVRRRRSTDVP
jgi:cytochrome P450